MTMSDPEFASVEQVPVNLNFADNSTDVSLRESAVEEAPAEVESADTGDSTVDSVVEGVLTEELSMGFVEEEAERATGEASATAPDSSDKRQAKSETSAEEPSKKSPGEGRLSLPAALCDEQLLQELSSIPDKMGFKIGEVAEMLGIKQYVLRYWETEFDVLKPKKAANNQRYYTKKDVENVFLIRKLLHRDRFSIEGARSALKELKTVVRKEKDWSQVNQRVESLQERVDQLIGDLRRLREIFT